MPGLSREPSGLGLNKVGLYQKQYDINAYAPKKYVGNAVNSRRVID
jgi:hypothetical protein